MRYTFLLYSDESTGEPADEQAAQEELAVYGAYIGALQEAGVLVDTDWLQPSSTATTVTTKDGGVIVQDGPFADTREALGGYFVIDAPDLDVALEWAKKCPAAQYGHVEVRSSAMPTQ